MVGFLFGGDTQETPESIKRKRDIVRALMGASAPKNIGEGINALGDGIVSAVLNDRANKAEGAGRQSADSDFSALSSLFGGGSTAMPTPGAAAELSATDPATAGGPSNYRDAIASIESDGSGGYSAVGPTHPKMGRALGRYQVMESNIGPWAKEALGREITADEFLANPKLQDAIFDKKFGGYVEQFGPEGAAQAWFAGPGGVGKTDRKDVLGTSVGGYTDKFRKALGSSPQQVASIDPAAGMPPPTAPQAQAQAYVDPMVSAPNASPQGAPPAMASGGTGQPDQQLAALPAPVNVATPPIPPNAMPPQNQVAQALRQPPRSSNAELQAAQKVLSNQFSSDGQRAVAQALLRQELDRRNTEYEMQLKQQDPAYQLNLQKGQIELDNLRNPRISPAEQRRLDLEQQKFDYERNKPRDPTKMGQGETLVGPDGKVIYKSDPKPDVKPSAVQEYEYAKGQGFPGTFQDWEASKKGGMSLHVDPATGAVTFQQGGNIKPMTEGQSKDTVYATRAEGALARLNENAAALSNLGESMASGVPIAGNYMLSPEYQQAQQAGKEFLQAILRKDTGAAITKQETDEYGTVYLPQPGDSAEVAQQKAISRTRALEALKAGMPPQAIIAKEKALTATGDKKPAAPAGEPDFSKMTDEELQRYIDGK